MAARSPPATGRPDAFVSALRTAALCSVAWTVGEGAVRWARVAPLRRREANGGLEVVAAVLAMPKVAHTAAVEIFRPFRDE